MKRTLILWSLILLSCVAVGCTDPGDEGFTILLQTTRGPRHIQNATFVVDALEKDGWDGVYAVIKDGRTELFWGKYRSVESAHGDLLDAKKYRNVNGFTPFVGALIMPRPGKALGPPEWNLFNAKGEYTVLVATFFNVPRKDFFQRKQVVVDLCREYRKQGHEAYYYHGPTKSHVTVGAFPESAIRVTNTDRTVRVVFRDERIKTIIDHFKELVVNYYAQVSHVTIRKPGPNFGKREMRRSSPYLTRIPKRENETIGDHIGTIYWKRQ